MFILSSDLKKKKNWHLHDLYNLTPLTVKTVKPLRREKVGLLILVSDQDKKCFS